MNNTSSNVGNILQILSDVANDIFDDRLSCATFKIGQLIGYLKTLKPIQKEKEDGSGNSKDQKTSI